MPGIVAPRARGFALPVKQTERTISGHVTGWDNADAPGRVVLLLGRNQFGAFEVKAETVTDSNGDYAFAINGGPNDRYVVVGVGDNTHAEHSAVLGNMEAVD